MPDEETGTQVVELDELEPRNLNHLLPTDKAVKLTPDNHKNGIKITNQGKIKEGPGYLPGRTTIEMVDTSGNDLNESEQFNLVVEAAEGTENAFVVNNPNLREPMTIWVYGEKKIIEPGGKAEVPALKPAKYKDLEGVEDGVFYATIGSENAIKVSRKPLSSEVTLGNFSMETQNETENEDSVEYSRGDYEEAKSKIEDEIRKNKELIADKIPDYKKTLDISRQRFPEDVPDVIRKLEQEVERYIQENQAALAWLENPTDNSEQRKLVAGYIIRKAEEDIQFALMESKSPFSNSVFVGDWEALEKRSKELKRYAKILATYRPKQ